MHIKLIKHYFSLYSYHEANFIPRTKSSPSRRNMYVIESNVHFIGIIYYLELISSHYALYKLLFFGF